MISWEEAVERIGEELQPLGTERVALLDAIGRALGETVTLPCDLPAWDNSAMDGYALRAADAGPAPSTLPVAGERWAGSAPGAPIAPGTAVRIFTGAPLPPGADAIVKQEETTREGDRVTLHVEPRRGDFVRPAGEDGAAGTVALAPGHELLPPEIGRLAALGRSHVAVHLRPRVGILASGDELLAPDEPMREGGIRESNAFALAAAAIEAGALPVILGIARDRAGEAERLLAAAAISCDAVVTCGGASVGERDLLKDALRGIGAEERFWRVAIKPGKPFGFYRLPGGKPVFLLPGKPASASVTFEIFVRPGLRRLAGLQGHGRPEVELPLAAPARKSADLALWVRGNLQGGRFVASPHQSSGLTRSLVGQRALATLPVGPASLEAGHPVLVRLLGGAPARS
ncbi:gephyrin-like molybdotransferase Glp [Vulgatibacter sp.]|uniref:molybdopterin molybdotransferase MoeA n=1 Tax=Vulgatibacter sp. TaxID=1971226 RepID=UPI0035663770